MCIIEKKDFFIGKVQSVKQWPPQPKGQQLIIVELTELLLAI